MGIIGMPDDMNIKKLYLSLLDNDDQWCYYPFEPIRFHQGCTLYDLLLDDCQYRFILDLLKRGGKGDIECTKHIQLLSTYRKQHTISCFLLGNHIYNECHSLHIQINSILEKLRNTDYQESVEKRFRYIWMLISIFHDLGYGIEEQNININDKEITSALTHLALSKYALKPPYTRNLIKNYFKFRKECMNKIDHGIAGGALLYQDLCALRKQKEGKDNTLFWGKVLEKDFAFASWTIACHNIYKIQPNNSSEPCYKKYHLNKLINDNRLINKEKLPLLFLLCLVDTIDPIKYVNNISILECFHMEFDKDRITISVKDLPDNIRCKYLGKLLFLRTWLSDVDIIDDNNVIIKV